MKSNTYYFDTLKVYHASLDLMLWQESLGSLFTSVLRACTGG